MYARVYKRGPAATICFLANDDGTSDVGVFLSGLDVKTRRVIRTALDKVAEVGPSNTRSAFRPLDNPIAEFKYRNGYRLFCFRHENCYIITHARMKPPGDQVYKTEIKRTKRLMEDWENDGRRFK